MQRQTVADNTDDNTLDNERLDFEIDFNRFEVFVLRVYFDAEFFTFSQFVFFRASKPFSIACCLEN